MLQRLVEFFARGISFGQIVWVTKFPGVRRERRCHVHQFVEAGFVRDGFEGQLSDVVSFLRRDSAVNQKSFDGLFRRLLAMVNGGVERGFFSRAEETGTPQIARRLGQPGTQQFPAGVIHTPCVPFGTRRA